MSNQPAPWEVDGLPGGLAPAHFVCAADAVLLGSKCWVGERPTGAQVKPVHGTTMAQFRLYGTHHVDNQRRLSALWSATPMAATSEGSRLHPAVLVADPSPSQGGVTPVGVCSRVGYVGSAWNASLTTIAQRLSNDQQRRVYWATRITLSRDASSDEVHARAWLPSDMT